MRVFILCVLVALAFADQDGTDGGEITCAQKYNTCRKDAEMHDVKSIYQCGKDYFKCRALPVVDCAKQCHATLYKCRDESSGIVEKGQCYLDLAKCYKQCKFAPHNDEEEMLFDENDVEDGSGSDSCVEKYRTCSASSQSVQDRFKCGVSYAKCRGGPLLECAKTCHSEKKTCLASSSGIKNYWKCAKDFGSCITKCRLAPHNDEVENYEMSLDDGSGGESSCKDKYRSCRENAKSFKDKFTCGKEYLKCKGKPIGDCLKKCYEDKKTCSKNATGGRAHFECYKVFSKCSFGCRPKY